MRIALDAMGGDRGPGPVVAGAVQATDVDGDLSVVLVGDRAQIEAALAPAGGSTTDRIEIFHCSQSIGMGESPVDAIRKKPDNSISRGWQLLTENKVEAFVGAGSTGAMVAGGLRLRRFLPRVRRPGIAAVMPTAKGPCVILDVGANVNAKPHDLLQYAVMGRLYARHVLDRENPTIGLMNVGEEEGKGHELAKATEELLRSSPWSSHFIGNVEGRDIHRGTADVIVTDGFVGNVVLKTCEGVSEFVLKLVAKEVLDGLGPAQGNAISALQAMASRYHYSEFGGAPLLGIDGICVICHGSSGDRAIKNALSMAASYHRRGVNQKIVAELAAAPPSPDAA
jgi:glycerol-3-phosphate acyltransferase PlsX